MQWVCGFGRASIQQVSAEITQLSHHSHTTDSRTQLCSTGLSAHDTSTTKRHTPSPQCLQYLKPHSPPRHLWCTRFKFNQVTGRPHTLRVETEPEATWAAGRDSVAPATHPGNPGPGPLFNPPIGLVATATSYSTHNPKLIHSQNTFTSSSTHKTQTSSRF